MIKEELYNKTVDILVNAYFNDTLAHGNCFACAVGNIVAGNMGKKFEFHAGGFYLIRRCDQRLVWEGFKPNDAKRTITAYCGILFNKCPTHVEDQLKSTGYSYKELSQIELAFEEADWKESDDQRMFDGLMNVVNCLDIIHQNTNIEATTATKKRFEKALV